MNPQRGLRVYLLITFLVAWGIWEVPIRLGLSPGDPIFQYVALPGAFSPALAAFVVRKWIIREGFGDVDWRPQLKAWRSYLFAWLLPYPVVA